MRHGHPYQAFYCEENVWQLVQRLQDPEGVVLWLANAPGQFAMWCQAASPVPELPVVWDYHVVYARPDGAGWSVWDLDSRLPFPCPLSDWVSASFLPLPPEVGLEPPQVRVIAAATYLVGFASDRSHMRNAAGEWIALPPPWEPLGPGRHVLPRLLDVEDAHLGRVLDLQDLPGALGRSRSS